MNYSSWGQRQREEEKTFFSSYSSPSLHPSPVCLLPPLPFSSSPFIKYKEFWFNQITAKCLRSSEAVDIMLDEVMFELHSQGEGEVYQGAKFMQVRSNWI